MAKRQKRLPQRARESIARGSSVYYVGHRFRRKEKSRGLVCKYCGFYTPSMALARKYLVGEGARCPQRPAKLRKASRVDS